MVLTFPRGGNIHHRSLRSCPCNQRWFTNEPTNQPTSQPTCNQRCSKSALNLCCRHLRMEKIIFFLDENNWDYEFTMMVMIPLTDTDFHLGRWLFSLTGATQHRRCHARALIGRRLFWLSGTLKNTFTSPTGHRHHHHNHHYNLYHHHHHDHHQCWPWLLLAGLQVPILRQSLPPANWE